MSSSASKWPFDAFSKHDRTTALLSSLLLMLCLLHSFCMTRRASLRPQAAASVGLPIRLPIFGQLVHGVRSGLRTAAQAQLGQDVGDVVFGRPPADDQTLRDL